MYLPLCGENLAVQSYPTPHGTSLSPKRPKKDRRDWGVSTAAWKGDGSPIIHGTPHGALLSPKRPTED